MLIIPAIDIRGGKCVRLRQGDYAQETVFGDDPAEMAQRWVEQGATYLHLVDLDGAREGRPINLDAVRAIIQAAGVPCELGGGLRQEADLRQAFDAGVDRVVIGTQALKKPEWFAEMAGKFPDRLLLGIDAKNGLAASHGWLEVSQCRATDVAARFAKLPLAGLIYTDISRDGMMEGPNFEAIGDMVSSVKLPLIASGGVTTLDDIRRLAEMRLAGCIVGRAVYEGSIQLHEAIRLSQTEIHN